MRYAVPASGLCDGTSSSSRDSDDSESEVKYSPLSGWSSIESSREAGSEGVVPSDGECGRVEVWTGDWDSSPVWIPRELAIGRLGVDLD